MGEQRTKPVQHVQPGDRVRVVYEGYWAPGTQPPASSEIAGRIVRDEQSFVYFALPAWAEIEVLSGQPEADR